MKRKLKEALESLNELIDIGVEFPDAVWNVTQTYGVDSIELEDAYDQEQMSGGRDGSW